MKKPLLLLLCWLFVGVVTAQVPNYRLRFHYRLTNEKLEKIANLQAYPLYLTNDNADNAANPDTFRLCTEKVLKVIVKSADETGALKIDTWSINDYRVNRIAQVKVDGASPTEKPKVTTANSDPCYGRVDRKVSFGRKIIDSLFRVNAGTKTSLKIQLPKRTQLGVPVTGITLPYRTWLFGINAIAFKTRPRVEDYKGNKINAALTSGNFSLGLSYGHSFGFTHFTQRTSNSWSATFSGGLGLSGTKLKDEPLTRFVDVSTLPSNFVFSPTGTITLARNDIGIILAFGLDHMVGNAASAWAYQDKFFFGFGISNSFKL